MEVYIFKKLINAIIVSDSLFKKKKERNFVKNQDFKRNIALKLLLPKILKRKFYPMTIFREPVYQALEYEEKSR